MPSLPALPQISSVKDISGRDALDFIQHSLTRSKFKRNVEALFKVLCAASGYYDHGILVKNRGVKGTTPVSITSVVVIVLLAVWTVSLAGVGPLKTKVKK
ncbi:hypothetical protein KIPB_004397 [Kipferlia bialata]|uniref:Transmembrane protein n=1 Tax=Kipferlia bialata TaxID=797122 RepID=A0A9K3CUG7_9EUKA|nr:hypothetical protein KIPB_004397 [Kipferlia bialata]|eukprot:g4397.t1